MEDVAEDAWEDANMDEVIDYLYHNKRCNVPVADLNWAQLLVKAEQA